MCAKLDSNHLCNLRTIDKEKRIYEIWARSDYGTNVMVADVRVDESTDEWMMSFSPEVSFTSGFMLKILDLLLHEISPVLQH